MVYGRYTILERGRSLTLLENLTLLTILEREMTVEVNQLWPPLPQTLPRKNGRKQVTAHWRGGREARRGELVEEVTAEDTFVWVCHAPLNTATDKTDGADKY